LQLKYCKEQNSSKCRSINKVHFASYLFTHSCMAQLREHKNLYSLFNELA